MSRTFRVGAVAAIVAVLAVSIVLALAGDDRQGGSSPPLTSPQDVTAESGGVTLAVSGAEFSGTATFIELAVRIAGTDPNKPTRFRIPAEAFVPEAYSSNFPGRKYLDTQASDPPGLESWTVGTLDAEQFQTYTWYYGNVLGTADYAGPNWYQLRFEVGDSDDSGWGCGIWISYDWCMLYPDHGYARVPLTNHYTFPNHLYWWGQ